jgi:hypothetical protein
VKLLCLAFSVEFMLLLASSLILSLALFLSIYQIVLYLTVCVALNRFHCVLIQIPYRKESRVPAGADAEKGSETLKATAAISPFRK